MVPDGSKFSMTMLKDSLGEFVVGVFTDASEGFIYVVEGCVVMRDVLSHTCKSFDLRIPSGSHFWLEHIF